LKRSILSVVAGVVTIGVLVVCGDQALPRLFPGAFDDKGFTTNGGALAVMLVYTVVFSAIGGWVTSMVSRRGDSRDVQILAGLQFAMTIVFNVMLWDSRLAWFYAIGALLTPVAILIGGRIRGAGTRTHAATPASS
jgi:hypothetical protein